MHPYCGYDDCDCGSSLSQILQPVLSLTTMSSCQSTMERGNYFTGAVEPKELEPEESEHLLLHPKDFRGSSGSGIRGNIICGMWKAKSVKVQQQQQVGTTTTGGVVTGVVNTH